jgi:hypothetical protein
MRNRIKQYIEQRMSELAIKLIGVTPRSVRYRMENNINFNVYHELGWNVKEQLKEDFTK